jgi:signal peptidase I
MLDRRAMTERMRLEDADVEFAAKESGRGSAWTIGLIALVGALLLIGRVALFQPFNIPSGSLMPTLLIGDYVFVAKYAYGYSHFSLPTFLDLAPGAMRGRLFGAEPRRGDVVVFKLPRDGKTDYIKRVIGLPGDRIQLLHGRLYINGAIVERTPLPPFSVIGHFGSPIEVARYEESLPGGVKHEIIEMDGDEGYWDNTNVYEVPPGNYFMLGDNRDNSTDSRVSAEQEGVGFVPFDNLVGRAEMVFFSLDDGDAAREKSAWPGTFRWDRILHPVR